MGKSGRNIAVILAAGTGSRMKAGVAKQFLELDGKPLIYYALQAMEQSKIIHECILVTGENDMQKMQSEVVSKYGFQKVTAIICGGSERCFSVANAMRWIASITKDEPDANDIVFIHDGARPFLTEEILERTLQAAKEYGACVAAMPSKDTVKLVDDAGFAKETPNRKTVWAVQTPQVFDRKLIVDAYRKMEEDVESRKASDVCSEGRKAFGDVPVTDDASVVELYTDVKVKVVEGGYSNIKVTTPDDLVIARAFLR